MNVSVRDVNPEVFRSFKAEAIKLGMRTGSAVNEALKVWIEVKTNKRKTKSFFDLKPRSFGIGKTNATAEMDRIVYGGQI